jgi:CheY-like chemotaxis protein
LANNLTQETTDSPKIYPSILLITEDPFVHQAAQSSLSHLGIRIYSSFNAVESLELAHQILPNAIVLDVQMPSMSGWDVLKQLKLQPLTSGIPVILLTIDDEQHISTQIGANDYLFKPIDRDRLITTIEKYRPELQPQLSVLVIEDDINVRSMLKRMLEKENYVVLEAQDGHEALEIMTAALPQLILLDLMMPNINGFEFMHLLRLQQDLPSIPIVIITARDLNKEDCIRLNGSVQKILQKTNSSYTQMFEEVVQRLYKFGILTRSPI